MFQLTAARRRLALHRQKPLLRAGFNSQPPEGGWKMLKNMRMCRKMFQLTAARRRLVFRCNSCNSL